MTKVTRSARKATRQVTDGASTLRALKKAAHRKGRRANRAALKAAGADFEPVVTLVTSHDVS